MENLRNLNSEDSGLSFPKTRALFIFAGCALLYYAAYIMLLINVICKTGGHLF
jgi:hypothetical protein